MHNTCKFVTAAYVDLYKDGSKENGGMHLRQA